VRKQYITAGRALATSAWESICMKALSSAWARRPCWGRPVTHQRARFTVI
jgi:hypothetical protein